MLSTLYALLDQLPRNSEEQKLTKDNRRKKQAQKHIKHLVIKAKRSNTEKELNGHYRYVYNELLRRAKVSDSIIRIIKVVSIGEEGVLHLHCIVFCSLPIDSLFRKSLKRCWFDEPVGTTKNLAGLVEYLHDKNLIQSLSKLQERFAIRKFVTLPIALLFNPEYELIGERTDNVQAVRKVKHRYKLLTAWTCIFED